MDDWLKHGLAVVTGAGGGLGRALAIQLSQHGIRVAGLGRKPAGLEQTAALAGENFTAHICDVSDPAQVTATFQKLGPVTLLINNAAQYPRRDFLDETAESFQQVVDTNLGGTIACTSQALKSMVETGKGRILNVATFADIAPLPASSAYAVSKGAARIFTRALVADLGDRFPDIVITDWMPGMLATQMGIPDGLAPEIAAGWGAALALWHDPTLNGATFEMDREILPPRGLKRKVKDAMLLRKPPRPRRIPLS